jgi:plastocyanin
VKRGLLGVVVTVAAALSLCATAAAAPSGVEHLHFHAGPFRITPGANLILIDSNRIPKPTVDGYMVRMAPNLKYALPNGKCCGSVPLTNVIHLHHGVWLSNGAAGEGEGNSYVGHFYPFMASGEEKTIYTLPHGYGYPIGAKDFWVLNYMIHNLTARPASVYVTYDMDFIPADTPAAANIKPAHPIWMDVQDHHLYPVFNVKRGSGRNGKFTYPDMAKDPYGSGAPLNLFTVDHPGTLLGTAGHLHPGGLYDDLDLIRPGATPSHGAIRGPVPNSVRLFRSYADYFGHRPPISWDMAMTASAPSWRVQVNAGDQLRISATYETRHASWYEVMGIMIVWEAWNDDTGVNPFTHKLDQQGHVTHGYLKENRDWGGTKSLGVSVNKFPTCHTKKVVIAGFNYLPGDFTATGRNRCIPTVRKGHSLTFVNDDASRSATLDIFSPSELYKTSIFHSITTCKYPCGLNTGIAYPLANGSGNFDSGQLGAALPAVGTLTWNTSTHLPPGTYTFFCRIHPFMRGVFRVVG